MINLFMCCLCGTVPSSQAKITENLRICLFSLLFPITQSCSNEFQTWSKVICYVFKSKCCKLFRSFARPIWNNQWTSRSFCPTQFTAFKFQGLKIPGRLKSRNLPKVLRCTIHSLLFQLRVFQTFQHILALKPPMFVHKSTCSNRLRSRSSWKITNRQIFPQLTTSPPYCFLVCISSPFPWQNFLKKNPITSGKFRVFIVGTPGNHGNRGRGLVALLGLLRPLRPLHLDT